jgi:2-haloacid dehalogenase
MMQPAIVFDVNETLLDLSPVRNWFAQRFGDEPDASVWFGELLRLSFVSAVTDRYVPFPDLAKASLVTVGTQFHASVGDGDLSHIGNVFTTLPPHDDVEGSLAALRNAGFTLAALTNSPLETAEVQLENAGIAESFDRIMSVEMVGRFKPHRSVYEAGARSLSVSLSDMVMVAAHDWDISGAMAAGCEGVFIERTGQSFSSAFSSPTISVPNLEVATERIIERFS